MRRKRPRKQRFGRALNSTPRTTISRRSNGERTLVAAATFSGFSLKCRVNSFTVVVSGSMTKTSPCVESKANQLRTHRSGSQRSEEHTSELQSQSNLVCRLLLEKKKSNQLYHTRDSIQGI